jgi:integrase/recombinase XerD
VPNILDPLGLRDRAMLETLYSTGARRSELARLEIHDLNQERQTLHIRQGKGHKDRVVPVGCRALEWLARYLEEVRPRLVLHAQERALFLTSYGEPFNPDVLSRMVSKWLKQADIGRPGSCHLVRHTTAVHLLEGGADIRFIQQLLGHEKLEKRRRLVGVLDRSEATCPEGVSSRKAAANQTTAIYTQVSIEQLKAVHARCHPAENPAAGTECKSS